MTSMPNQLSSQQSMTLLGRRSAGCMSLLARPCLPRFVHRMPAAFAPLHRSAEKTAYNSNRRCHSRASIGAETETVSKQSVTVRPAMLSELDDVAWLRAEAFYEVTLHMHCARVLGRRSNERLSNPPCNIFSEQSRLISRLRHGTWHLCRISLTCGMLAPSSGSSRSRKRGLSEIAQGKDRVRWDQTASVWWPLKRLMVKGQKF